MVNCTSVADMMKDGVHDKYKDITCISNEQKSGNIYTHLEYNILHVVTKL